MHMQDHTSHFSSKGLSSILPNTLLVYFSMNLFYFSAGSYYHYKQIYPDRNGVVLSKREVWWIRLINIEWDSRENPFFGCTHTPVHPRERRGSMEHHSAVGAGSAGQGKSGVSSSPSADPAGITGAWELSPKGFGTPSVGACGCSYTSETCPETFSSITYDVLAQILEVLPGICSAFPTGKSCLHGKVLGRVCCEINEGKRRFNRNDKKEVSNEIFSRPLLSAECVAQIPQPHKKQK